MVVCHSSQQLTYQIDSPHRFVAFVIDLRHTKFTELCFASMGHKAGSNGFEAACAHLSLCPIHKYIVHIVHNITIMCCHVHVYVAVHIYVS